MTVGCGICDINTKTYVQFSSSFHRRKNRGTHKAVQKYIHLHTSVLSNLCYLHRFMEENKMGGGLSLVFFWRAPSLPFAGSGGPSCCPFWQSSGERRSPQSELVVIVMVGVAEGVSPFLSSSFSQVEDRFRKSWVSSYDQWYFNRGC
jgi:hypothetical protein